MASRVLGKQLPQVLTVFWIEAFFTFTLSEHPLTEDHRRAELLV